MSTFFEKLTNTETQEGGGIPPETAELASSRTTAARRPVRRMVEEEQPHEEPRHLSVQAEKEEETAMEPEEEEEEGELTVDIYDKGEKIVIQSTVAGVKPEDLDVSITDDTVTIRGKRLRQEEVKEENYYYKELFWGSFSRSVILPEEIDQEAAEASLQHGLLTIRLPKKRKGVVQKLKVKIV